MAVLCAGGLSFPEKAKAQAHGQNLPSFPGFRRFGGPIMDGGGNPPPPPPPPGHMGGPVVTGSGSPPPPPPQDPGVRSGDAGAGGTFPILDNTSATQDALDKAYFAAARTRFQEVSSVSGTIEPGFGLGPTFNGNSCAMCHAQPSVGGGSPFINPQVANNFANLDGASNPGNLSQFLTINGPVRVVRFIKNPDGTADGGVHDLFTVTGRTDAPGCTLQQPDFATALSQQNAIFRIPTSVYGLGLVEFTPDAALQANLAATSSQRTALGIGGEFNTSGNDGTITRFGWKAQNKSLLMFAGEAYNVEEGVTNELFPDERYPAGTSASGIAAATFNATPEDFTNEATLTPSGSPASDFSSDIVNFAAFARLSAPPTPTTATLSQLNGQHVFNDVGCVLCHTATLTTGDVLYPALSNYAYHPFSDFALHHMGAGLADGITQGAAGPDQFRTAPLWGLGQRIFFLHDGRTSDLMQAIAAHASSGSEANQVIRNFNALPPQQQQDILNFLRSL